MGFPLPHGSVPAKKDVSALQVGLKNYKEKIKLKEELDLPKESKDILIEDSAGKLNENEQEYILTTTLKPHHRNKPYVLTFIESFCRCRSISQASHEAGIDNKLGYRMRHTKDVAECIQKITDISAIKYGYDATEIYERVKEVVDFDPIEMQNPDGTYKNNLHDVSPEARRCLKKLKVRNLYNQSKDINGLDQKIIIGEVIEYEFYDKLKGVELAGREKDMFKNTTKVEHTITKDMAQILLESANRAEQRRLNGPVIIEAEVINE